MALPARLLEHIRVTPYGVEEDQFLQAQGPLDVFAPGSQTPLASVDLSDVFINDKATLHEIELLSRRDYPMRVFISWEQASEKERLLTCMEFQLENANLSASREVSDTSAPKYYNELLNHACTVSDFTLPAGRRQPLVLVLYPCVQDPAGAATSFSKVHGFVHFSARRATPAELEAEGLSFEGAVERGYAEGNDRGGASERSPAKAFQQSQGMGKEGIGNRDVDGRESGAEETLLEVKAKVCRSILSADIRELQFLEACPGASYVKEFSVWNKSEIPLTFRLVPSVWLSAEAGVLACSDYDTGAPLPTSSPGRTIGAYAHLRVRVAFRPREVGERDYRIFVENLNNVADILAVDILTSVVSDSHRDGLRIQTEGGELLEGGSVLQFDDCYTGIPTPRRLRVKNTTVKAMDISLGSDRPGEVMFELETDASASYRRARRRLNSMGNSEESRITCSRRSGDDVAFGTGTGLGIDGRLSTRDTSSYTESGESSSAHGEEGQADVESEVAESGVRVMGSPLDSLDNFLKAGRGKKQFYALDSKAEWGSDRMSLTARSSIFSRRDRRRDHGRTRVGEGDERSRGNRNSGSAANGSGPGTRYRKQRGFCPSEESGDDSDDSSGGCLGSGNRGTSSRSTRFGNSLGARGDLYGRCSVHKKVGRTGAAVDDDDRDEEYDSSDVAGVVGVRSARASYADGPSGGRRGVPDGRGALGGGVHESSNRGLGGGEWVDYVEERQGLKGVYGYGDDDGEEEDEDDLEPSRVKRTVRHQRRRKLRNLGHRRTGGYGGLCAFHGSVYSPTGWNASITSGDVGRVGSGNVGGCVSGEDEAGAYFVGRNYGAQQRGAHCRVCTEIAKRARKNGTGLGRKNEEQDRSAGHQANNYIEEVSLGPGVERILRVHFCAASPALNAVATAGGVASDADDGETLARSNTNACAMGVASTALLSSQERGGRGRRGLTAASRGTTLSKQAFKLFFTCQEPRGKWDDALLDESVDAEGYIHSQAIVRRKSSIGSDVRQFSKNIAGRAMVCTSVLKVAPREITFGNCNIGEYKSHTLEIGNMSDLPAVAIAHVVSKVVTCKPSKLEIPAHGKAEMKVEYVPRKINSKYRKTVTIVNCLNPHGNVDVEITGSNIDTHHVLYHSHFYKVLVNNRMRQQQVYFNHIVMGCLALRTFEIQNVYDRPLLFELSADTPEIQIYEMVGPNVKRASCSMMPAGTPGGKSGSSVGVGTKSTVWSGSGAGVDCASLSASSRREQFSKSPNVSGRISREGRHLHGPIRGMDLEMPQRSNRKYRTQSSYAGASAGSMKALRSGVGLAASDGMDGMGESVGGALLSGGASNLSGGSGTGANTDGVKTTMTSGPGTLNTKEGGGGAAGAPAIPGGDEPAWTLKQLMESFETDHLGSTLGSGEGVRGSVVMGGGAIRVGAGGGAIRVGAGGGQSDGFNPRTEREVREWQARVMRERVVQLRRAVKEGRLKPLANRLFQVHPGKHSRIAVVLNLASTGDAEELERERIVERHIQIRLLNVNSSHLPPSLQRGAPAASLDGGIPGRSGRSGLALPWREPLRIRNLLVRGKACRSEMSVAQKNINFGKVAVGEYATRTVELTNRSPVPMLYSISKSMSISSGFLKIPQGGKGVIPAHRSKEIEFAFCPSLAGTFAESLSVMNVLDEGSTQVITIKAKVYKPETFALVDPPEVMRLEPCLVGEPLSAKPPGEARVLLRNTTPRRRLFVIEGIDAYSAAKSATVGRDSCDSGLATVASTAASLSEGVPPSEGGSETSIGGTEGESAKGGSLSPRPDMASSRLRLSSAGSDVTTATDISRPIQDSGTSVLTNFSEVTSCSSTFRFKLDAVSTPGIPEVERKCLEEKLEHCLFKLRIAARKGREVKVAKIHKKIDRLRKQLAGETLGSDEGDETGMSESESDSDAELQLRERTEGGWGSGSIGGGGTGVGSNGVVKRDGVGKLELSVDGDSEIAVGISLAFTPGACFHGWEGGHLFRGVIRLYEHRNEDVVKQLPCLAQVYSSALAYQSAVQSSASPSVEDEVEDREVLSPMPPPSDGGSRGRKTSGKTMVMPPRSPTKFPSSNTSPTLSVSTSFSGGSVPTSSAPSHAAGIVGSSGSCSASGGGGVGSGGGSGGTSPLDGSFGDSGGGTGGSGGDGWGNKSAPVSPRRGGLPELLRQVGIQTRRVFGGGLNRDKERRDQSREAPEDAEAEGSVVVDGNTGCDDRAGSLLVPAPQRPDQSPSPSLEASSAISMMPTPRDKTSSPVSNLPRRRASYPSAAHPRSFVDLRGSDTRNSSPLPSSDLDQARDVYDPGRDSSLETRRMSAPPAIPAFHEVTPAKSGGDPSGEPPLLVTVAHFCTLGATEEGVASPAVEVGDVDEGNAENLLSVGGRGAVTPALFPALFPQGSAGCVVSDGVRMVLSCGENEAGAAPGGSASPGMFSLHSVASRDVIVKVSWDEESAGRLGVLPVPSPTFMFRAEPPKSGSQTASCPASVLVAVLHAGSTLDISVKLDGPVSIPVGRWCVGAVMVVVIDQSQAHGDSGEGGHGGSGSGCCIDKKLLVPLVLEVLPESRLGVPRKVDLGSVELKSHTPSSFEVQNLSSASAPLRFVVMVAGKPATNSLQLTSEQTGTLLPGESVHVSFVFHATSIGRWTHDLAVRNLGNKHDQAKVTVSATVKPHMYLHFPDLDPDAKGKPEKLQIGYCYMPGPSDSDRQETSPKNLIVRGNAFPESEIVRPLRVRNVSDRKLYLTCTPNLRKQCFVYAEVSPNSSHDGHRPEGCSLSESGDGATVGSDLAAVAEAVVPRPSVTDFPLLEQSEMTLFIGLRPVLPLEAYTSGDCRELIGGVRILGHSRPLSDSPPAALEAAVEGKSDLEVSEDSPAADPETGLVEPTEGAARSSGSLQVGAEGGGARVAAEAELTIKFVGTVGVSILRIPGNDSPFSLLNLGCGAWTVGSDVTDTGVVSAVMGLGATPGSRRRIVYGCLELENVTKALPLVYRLDVKEGQGHIVGDHGSHSDTGILARLGALSEGSAELVVLAEAVGTMPPASRRSVRFCILVHAFRGAFHRQIIVQNISSSRSGDNIAPLVMSKPLTYHVRLFVDDGCVDLELPSPSEESTVLTLPEVRPRISTVSAVDSMETVNSAGHEATLQQEKQLTDELGNILPTLETLTVPFVIPVAPCGRSAAEGAGPSSSTTEGEDRLGYGQAKLSRFRVLHPVVEDDDISISSAYDDLTEMHDIEEHVGTAVSGRDWTPFGGYHNSPTTRVAREGLRSSRSDLAQFRDEEDADGMVFRLTNTMDRTIFLAPYSNAPLVVEPVVVGKRCAGEASAGLFELENDGDDCCGPTDGFECGEGGERLPTPVMRDDVKEHDKQGSLVRCGPAITLTANATAVIRLGVRVGSLTRPLPTSSVESGQAVPFDGIIAFARICEASATQESRVSHHNGGWDGEGALDRVECHSPTSESSAGGHLRLVKLVRALGTFCRPRFEVAGPTVIDLGNVGHTASKRGRRRFEVRLRNLCDTPVPVGMVGISSELDVVTEMDGVYAQRSQGSGDRMVFHRRRAGPRPRSSSVGSAGSSAGEIHPRVDGSHAVVFASSGWGKRRPGDGGCLGILMVPPRGEATLVFQLRLSRRRQSWAGPQTFGIRLANLADPSVEEVSVSVLARVVTQLVSFIGLDEVPPSPILRRLISPGTPTLPELSARRRTRSSSIEAVGSFFASSEGCSVRLGPLAVPPPRRSTGRCTGTFQVKNVSDETVSVTLRATPAPEVSGVLSLGASLQQQDSSTGVYASAGADGRPSPSVALLPGDVLDVHAECVAQPGGCLTAELLQPPTFTSTGVAEGIPMDMRQGGLNWDQHLRLLGTVLVEIALEEREEDPDGSEDGESEHGEGVLIESIALVGSLIPGPTFELSHKTVTIALRPPTCGGEGVTPCDRSPFEPEGPASFSVESISPSQRPVRFRIEGGGRLHLTRGLNLPAADDEGGGTRYPAQVVKVVTAIAEPCRGIISAKNKREVAVRLTAAEQNVSSEGESSDRRGSADVVDSAYADVAGEQDRCDLFVRITDDENPGYPPQIVAVNVEIPVVDVVGGDSQAVGLLGASCLMGGVGDLYSYCSRDPEGTYSVPNEDVVDESTRKSTLEESSIVTSLEPTPPTKKKPSDSTHKQSSGILGSGGSPSRAVSLRGAEAAASIAAATAAAIAAGPLSLVASASEAAAIVPMARLEVRGCTPAGSTASLFEINLGQQLVCLSSLEWPISLMGPPVQRVRRGSNSSSLLSIGENRRILLGSNGGGSGSGWVGADGSSGPGRPDRLSLKFRLSTLHTSDAEWLTLGQREGQLMEGAIQDVTLYFNRSRVGVFSTYLVVENLNNPSDLKIVRVEMEVVDGGLKHNAPQLFDILVPPPIPESARGLLSNFGTVGTSAVGSGSSGNGAVHNGSVGTTNVRARVGDESAKGAAVGPVMGIDGSGMGGRAGSCQGVTNSRNIGDGGFGGGKDPLVLDFGDVYEGKLYQWRSFVIVNHAAMPLEFQLSSSLPSTEVNFSLSAMTLKQFKSVHIEANSRLQVYVHYQPLAKRQPEEARNSCEKGLPMSDACREPGVMVRERLCITCRLVKDFQQEIQLVARRHNPQVRLLVDGNLNDTGETRCSDSLGLVYIMREKSTDDTAGDAGATRVEVDGQQSRFVTVKNLRSTRRVVIAVVNVTMFFSITPATDPSGRGISGYPGVGDATGLGSRGWIQGLGAVGAPNGIELFEIPAGESLTLRVTPRLDKLRSGAGLALLANEQRIEEHLLVYNRRHPTEHYRISLKLTSDPLRVFFLSPGSKSAYPFKRLEDKITTFLKAYQLMWNEFLELNPPVKAVLSGERSAASNKELDSLLLRQALDRLDAAILAVRGLRSNSGVTGSPAGSGGGSGGLKKVAPSAALAQQSSRLVFEMCCITDELLYYALKNEGFVGEFALRLANLVYSVVFRHEVFTTFLEQHKANVGEDEQAPVFLRRWGAHLNHFLGYFPYPKPLILPLLELRRSLAPCFAVLPAA